MTLTYKNRRITRPFRLQEFAAARVFPVTTDPLAQAFCAGVAAASGVNRLPDPSLKTAETLAQQGVEPAAIRDYAIQMTLEHLKTGRQPPLTLNQVATWAGLS